VKRYLATVATIPGVLLVVGLDHWLVRLVALLITLSAVLVLGMVLEATNPAPHRTANTTPED